MIKMEKVRKRLTEWGHVVDFFDPWSTDIKQYDIYHHFSAMKWDRPVVHFAKTSGVKVVLETMYWDSFRYSLTAPVSDELRRLKRLVEYLFKRLLPRMAPNRRLLMMADALVANSRTEADLLKKHYAIPSDRICVVFNGVDRGFSEATPHLFRDRYGLENFILCTGIIEERKNQLGLIKALSGTDLELVLIGGSPGPHRSYLERCKELAGDRVHFIDALDHDDPLLKSAYAACSVLALPSWHETTGKSCLEAAILGKNVVMTTNAPAAREYFGDLIAYVNPGDMKALRNALLRAKRELPNDQLRQRISDLYLWEEVTRSREAIYEKLVSGRG